MRLFSRNRMSQAESNLHSQGDDFVRTQEQFSLPLDTSYMNPTTKRRLTICNLFCNYHQSISDIMRVLDETNECVVTALIEKRLIADRRKINKGLLAADRRCARQTNELTSETGLSIRLRSTKQ